MNRWSHQVSLTSGVLISLAGVLLAAGPQALAQGLAPAPAARPLADCVVVPQTHMLRAPHGRAVQVTAVRVDARVRDQHATITMDVSLRNPTGQRLEAELIVPVPDGAVVRGFAYQGQNLEPTAQLLPAEEARHIYDSIVARFRDPALLEFVGYNVVRSSVFPVDPNGTQQVRLIYEHLLPSDGNRVDFLLPRSESVHYDVPWHVRVDIRSRQSISTVYSPSHQLETRRHGPSHLVAESTPSAAQQPGAFLLSYLLEKNGVSASLLAYPASSLGGGYFLLLAGLPAQAIEPSKAMAIKREITLVIDRSGSMNGEKLDQVREAALQIIAALEPGEAFNLIAYNEAVEMFAAQPVPKTADSERQARTYLKAMNARGGTNIHDALLEALRPKPAPGALPIVLFLTDGLPTVGQTSEVAIRNVATASNPFERRVYTFGVGVDVNTPLLEKIADDTRGTTTFVLPGEDVELKVASVFRRLSGPVLAGPSMAVLDADGTPALGRVADVMPARLPDLFDGDQLVVLGRYIGEGPLKLHLSGNYLGTARAFDFTFDLGGATTRNAFVPRLWASRKIALLIDAIRQLGAGAANTPGTPNPIHDPRAKELIDEIVRLSTEFGILTEYTAFLAREGTDLAEKEAVLSQLREGLGRRAVATRSGLASVNQDQNLLEQRGQRRLNFTNTYFDPDMKLVSITTNVQQINDRAFYRKAGRWIDSRLVNKAAGPAPHRTVSVGSKDHADLVDELARQGRAGCVSLKGEILLEVNGRAVLVK